MDKPAFYEKANAILRGRGLELLDEEPARAGQKVLGRSRIAAHRLTIGVSELRMFRASPIVVTDRQRARILVFTEDAVPELDDARGYIAITHHEGGEIVVMGESLWWNWIRDEEADEAFLLYNLLTMPVRAD